MQAEADERGDVEAHDDREHAVHEREDGGHEAEQRAADDGDGRGDEGADERAGAGLVLGGWGRGEDVPDAGEQREDDADRGGDVQDGAEGDEDGLRGGQRAGGERCSWCDVR